MNLSINNQLKTGKKLCIMSVILLAACLVHNIIVLVYTKSMLKEAGYLELGNWKIPNMFIMYGFYIVLSTVFIIFSSTNFQKKKIYPTQKFIVIGILVGILLEYICIFFVNKVYEEKMNSYPVNQSDLLDYNNFTVYKMMSNAPMILFLVSILVGLVGLGILFGYDEFFCNQKYKATNKFMILGLVFVALDFIYKMGFTYTSQIINWKSLEINPNYFKLDVFFNGLVFVGLLIYLFYIRFRYGKKLISVSCNLLILLILAILCYKFGNMIYSNYLFIHNRSEYFVYQLTQIPQEYISNSKLSSLFMLVRTELHNFDLLTDIGSILFAFGVMKSYISNLILMTKKEEAEL